MRETTTKKKTKEKNIRCVGRRSQLLQVISFLMQSKK